MIRFENVCKTYKGSVAALRDVTVDIKRGEFVFIVGPLRFGQDHVPATGDQGGAGRRGRIWVAGKDVGALAPWKVPYLRRNIGCIFQDYRLLPERTCTRTCAFALEVIGRQAQFVRSQVPQILEPGGPRQKDGPPAQRTFRR